MYGNKSKYVDPEAGFGGVATLVRSRWSAEEVAAAAVNLVPKVLTVIIPANAEKLNL